MNFVKLTASEEGRTLEMIAPVDRAWDALWALAEQCPNTFCFEARLVDTIDLRKAT